MYNRIRLVIKTCTLPRVSTLFPSHTDFQSKMATTKWNPFRSWTSLTSVKPFLTFRMLTSASVVFWSQQELGGSERLWLCNYRPPEVNYSYLCLVPPIWTTQAARPLSLSLLSFSPSLLNPWSGPNYPTPSFTASPLTSKLSSSHSLYKEHFLFFLPFSLFLCFYPPFSHSSFQSPPPLLLSLHSAGAPHSLKETVPGKNFPTLGRKRLWVWKLGVLTCQRLVILFTWAILKFEILVRVRLHDQKR